MSAPFRVFSTHAFDRSIKRLARKNPDIQNIFDGCVSILETDPHNISRQHNVKKLTTVASGDGQWRIRSGVYRLRYDIEGNRVLLHSINHRKDAY